MQIKQRAVRRRSSRGASRHSATLLKHNPRRTQRSWPRRLWRPLLVTAVLAVVLAGVFGIGGALGILIERSDKTDDVLAANPIRIGANYLKSIGAEPERLVIDIKHKHYEKLKTWRKLALERDQITADLKQYVPATLRFRDKVMKAELRLKGEWNDHVKTSKWSYRIKVKGENTLLGMTQFSVQHPRTRDYIYEWFYHQALAREDVATLGYHFVAVTVNGRDLGVFALEEHFTKQMVEHNRRRQGVVVHFNADYRYHPYSDRDGVIDMDFDSGIKSEHSSTILVYDEEKYAGDPVMAEQVRTARNLLEAFRAGRLSTHQVFDVDRMAIYFAVSELTGSLFTIDDWSDKRFLYNPVTSLLEPIGLEGAHEPLDVIMGATYNSLEAMPTDFHARMFADPVFMKAYVAALDKVSKPSYVDQLLKALEPQLNQQLEILYREWPHRGFSRSELYHNAEIIRAFLNPRNGLHAYPVDRGQAGVCTLEVGAIQPLPVEVLEVVSQGRRFAPPGSLLLTGKPRADRVQFQTVEFAPQDGAVWDESLQEGMTVRYRLLGKSAIKEMPVQTHRRLDPQLFDHDVMRIPPNFANRPFLEVDPNARSIDFLPGTARIDRSLVIPVGYVIRAKSGTVIDLVEGSSIICHSPLELIGSEDQPVVVMSSDGTGQGLAVLGAERGSRLRHVVFRGLSTPRQQNWELTGAVTFYRSPVDIEDCEFIANHSEDGLNIVSTQFTIRRTHFENTTSDALDVDYTSGKIQTCTFHAIGGDGIDCSGSRVEVANVRMSDIGDKGVSVGEETVFRGQEIHIERASTGVATKDLSDSELEGITVSDSRVGLSVYQKKQEFGPATVRVLDVPHLEKVATAYVVEQGSRVEVHGRVVPASHERVIHLSDAEAPANER